MAIGLISDTILTDIANAIRSKNGTDNQYYPSGMDDAILAIKTSPKLEKRRIHKNGIVLPHNGYVGIEELDVDVPSHGDVENESLISYVIPDQEKINLIYSEDLEKKSEAVSNEMQRTYELITYDLNNYNVNALNTADQMPDVIDLLCPGVPFTYKSQYGNSDYFKFSIDGNTGKRIAVAGKANNSRNVFGAFIDPSVYGKLQMDISHSGNHSAYNIATLYLVDRYATPSAWSSNSPCVDIKSWTLANYSITAAAIMAQEGITINLTNQWDIPRQIVEIDLSGIEQEFYVAFHLCESTTTLYSLKAIKVE